MSSPDKIRSQEVNDKMWAMLGDIAKQIPWMVNFQLRLLSPEDWKTVLSACFKQETRLASTIDGDGFVLLGARTSRMTPRQMSEFIEFIYAFGASRDVKWTEPKPKIEEDHHEADNQPPP